MLHAALELCMRMLHEILDICKILVLQGGPRRDAVLRQVHQHLGEQVHTCTVQARHQLPKVALPPPAWWGTWSTCVNDACEGCQQVQLTSLNLLHAVALQCSY